MRTHPATVAAIYIAAALIAATGAMTLAMFLTSDGDTITDMLTYLPPAFVTLTMAFACARVAHEI